MSTTKGPEYPVVDTISDPHAGHWQDDLNVRAQHAWIASKGKRPAFSAHFWPRQALFDQAFQQHPVVWLNCAAGYGKTLLMSEYSEQQQDALIWFRCDDNDHNAAALLKHLLEVSERQLEGIATNALAHWQFSDSDAHTDVSTNISVSTNTRALTQAVPDDAVTDDAMLQRILLLWLQEVATFERPILLCLDDIQQLSDASALHLILRLLEERPDNLRMVLASRYLPQPLARLRLQQQIAWLSHRELAFSDDQVQRFLMHNEVEQAGRLVPALNSRLQGWPAGLSLWLGCYRALGKPAEPPALLGQAEMSDYLQGETLHSLTPELQSFIQQAAVIGRFNEALLQHCLGASDYHAQLQAALTQNLFITTLADRPGWFHIHPVMASLLSRQLSQPVRQAIHSRAYDWLANGKDRMAALYHAREAGLSEEIVPWVEQQAEYLIGSMDIAAILEWLDLLGDELLQRSPRLMQIAAWSWLFTQQREKAQPLVQTLLGDRRLEDYERAALEGYLARLDGDIKRAETLCKYALEQLPPERFTVRILMSTTLSLLCLMNHDADGARIWNRFAQDLARQYQVPAMEAQVLFDYARIELNRGHIRRSLSVIEQGLSLLASHDEQCGVSLGRLLSYKAFALWLMGEPRAGLIEMMQQGISASTSSHDIAVCYGYALLAMAKTEMGKFDRALDLLDQVERLMQRWQVGLESYQWLAMIKANVWISQGKLARARSYIDEFVDRQANSPFVDRQINSSGRGAGGNSVSGANSAHSVMLRSDVFPMLPGFIAATRARLHLMANDPQACIAEADQWLRNNNQSLMSAVVMMFRAVALRVEYPADSDSQLRHLQQVLEREGIGMDLNRWIPNLSQASQAAGNGGTATDVAALPANVSLSERELEVLRKIDQGLSNQEIADQLFISLHTVKTHARKINVKLGAKSRTQALHRAKELLLI